MKSHKRFILFIVILLGIMFVVEYNLPKKFVWKPTFSHLDNQPLGCMLFDSVLLSSLPKGYNVVDKTLYQLHQEDSVHKKGILILSTDINFRFLDIDLLLKLAKQGNKFMLVASDFNEELYDSLRFYCTRSNFDFSVLKEQLSSDLIEKDSIYWVGDSTVYSPRMFRFYSSFCTSNFLRYDSLPTLTLMQKDKQQSVNYDIVTQPDGEAYRNYHPGIAFVRSCGEGKIILVSTPLLFTNYGILEKDGRDYIFRLLSQMGDLHIVRTEAYMDRKKEVMSRKSPFRYFLTKPPLRLALYLTMIGIILFMFFTARRKQRVIPVVSAPENKTLEFIALIGTLYFQKKDHADLVRKKYIYFSDFIRKEVRVDIDNQLEQGRMLDRLSKKTGMAQEELGSFFDELRRTLSEGSAITSKQMKYYIDKMNEIINQI